MTDATFPTLSDKPALERGAVLAPRFDASGLIPCVTTDAATGEVLMVGYMNAEALRASLDTGIIHYFSRSKRRLWMKGETSGQTQTIVELRVDCDQDALWAKVIVGADGGVCHTGFKSCFYRVVEDGALVERP